MGAPCATLINNSESKKKTKCCVVLKPTGYDILMKKFWINNLIPTNVLKIFTNSL